MISSGDSGLISLDRGEEASSTGREDSSEYGAQCLSFQEGLATCFHPNLTGLILSQSISLLSQLTSCEDESTTCNSASHKIRFCV